MPSGRVALDRTSDSNLKYKVEAADLTNLARLAGQQNVGGAATLDGTVTGNAAELRSSGTLDGSKVAYGDNSALDLNSTYAVTLPELTLKRLRAQADTSATFVKVGGVELKAVTAKTTFEGERLDFTTNIKEQTPRARCDRTS